MPSSLLAFARGSRRRALGLSIYGIAAALGVARIIENSTLLYQALRWGGVMLVSVEICHVYIWWRYL